MLLLQQRYCLHVENVSDEIETQRLTPRRNSYSFVPSFTYKIKLIFKFYNKKFSKLTEKTRMTVPFSLAVAISEPLRLKAIAANGES